MEAALNSVMVVGLEVLCFKIYMDAFLELRHSNCYWNIAMIIVLICANSLVAISITDFRWTKALLIIIIQTAISFLFYSGFLLKKFFLILGSYALNIAIDISVIILLENTINVEQNTWIQSWSGGLMIAFLSKTIQLLLVIILKSLFLRKNDIELLTKYEWLFFLYFPLFTITICLLYAGKGEEKTFLFSVFGIAVANFVVYFMIQDIMQRERKLREKQLKEEQIERQLIAFENIKEYNSQQQKIAHEYQNHLNCIQGFLQEGQNEKAKKYVANINRQWFDKLNYITTNNITIDIIVNQKLKETSEQKIVLIMKSGDLSDIWLEDKDIVILLSNLLNNAIESCIKMKENERWIKLRFNMEKDYIELSIKNPVVENPFRKDGKLVTAKKTSIYMELEC